MAYIYRLPSGLWRAQVAKRGLRKSQSFATKAAATAWATREETAILDGTASKWPAKTLADAINRYEKEVTPSKGSAVFERVAFGVIRREAPELCSKLLHTITAADIAAWRDGRAKHCSGSTVIRYAAILRNVWTVAAREWLWIPEPTPWRQVRLPQHNPPRLRVNGWREIRTQLRALNYFTGRAPETKTEEVGYAWLIALRTGLRVAEVLRISPETFDAHKRVLRLDEHKTKRATGRPRFVPISRQAARLIACCPEFTVTARSLDALFRKARGQAGLEGFTFHDSRATALTLLSRRVDVLTLQRISGHKNLNELLTYYRESDEAIASRL